MQKGKCGGVTPGLILCLNEYGVYIDNIECKFYMMGVRSIYSCRTLTPLLTLSCLSYEYIPYTLSYIGVLDKFLPFSDKIYIYEVTSYLY